VRLQTPAESPPALEPTKEQLEISARILLYLARQPSLARADPAPEALTQGGMAKALGASQGSVSSALRRLIRAGVVRVELSEVRSQVRRLRAYQLTPEGVALVRHIHERMQDWRPAGEELTPLGTDGAGPRRG